MGYCIKNDVLVSFYYGMLIAALQRLGLRLFYLRIKTLLLYSLSFATEQFFEEKLVDRPESDLIVPNKKSLTALTATLVLIVLLKVL